MTYAANLDKEGIESGYLLVIQPRRYVSTWTLVSGSIYRAAFDYGEVREVRVDDADLDLAASSSVASGEFYYDVDAQFLYVNVGSDPSSADVVAGYELYFGTEDAYIGRDPLDDTTRTVYFEPFLIQAPEVVADLRDTIFGFLPSTSGSIVLGNSEGILNRHLDSSFNAVPLALYHWLESITVENLKLVYRGLANRLSFTGNALQITVLDRNSIFDREYRHPGSDPNFFDETTFPGIDPNHKNRPIRKVFGVVEGVIGIGLNFKAQPDASFNDRFALHSGPSGGDSGTVQTFSTGGVNTTTRTYLNSVEGFRVDDDIYFITTLGEPAVVTAVGVNYVDHTAVSAPAASLEVVQRLYIGNVRIVMDGVTYRLEPLSGYTPADVSGVLVVDLDQTVITGLAGRPFAANDLIYCRFYGSKNLSTLGGSPFGSDSATTGNLTQGIVLLWNLFKEVLELDEAELDDAAFSSLQGTVPDEFGFELPFKTGSDFPIMREVVAKFCQSLLLKVFLNDAGDWSARQTAPLGAAGKTITDDEILYQRFAYSLDYADVVSDVFVEYRPSGVSQFGQVASDLSYLAVSSTSQVAKRLHRIVKQKTYQSLHFLEAEAQTLADRLKFYFGDRRGLLTIATKNRFFDSEIDDVITVSRETLPGEEFAEDVLRDRDFAVSATSKSLTEIEITLDDQKGIEDNAGDW